MSVGFGPRLAPSAEVLSFLPQLKNIVDVGRFDLH